MQEQFTINPKNSHKQDLKLLFSLCIFNKKTDFLQLNQAIKNSPFGNIVFIKDNFGLYDMSKIGKIIGQFMSSSLQNNITKILIKCDDYTTPNHALGRTKLFDLHL